MAQKFITFRIRDVQSHLSQDQKTALMGIVKSIRDGRSKSNLHDDVLFVLNARDRLAQHALDAYILAGQRDPSYVGNEGVVAAVAAAQEARDKGIMVGPEKLPSFA